MKKKILTLMTLLVGVCSGVWADNIYEWTHNKVYKSLSVTADKNGSSVGQYTGYTISYNTANDGKKTCSTAVKMESATTLTFTTSKTADIMVGLVLKNGNTYAASGKATVKLNGTASESAITKETTGSTTENAVYVTFTDVAAGNQVISRGGAELGVCYIRVTEKSIDTESPSITTDLNDETPYTASVGSPLALTIAASHYTGFQWYSCDEEGSNAEAIDGATSATYNYTPIAADNGTTKYFKCVVTNTNATGAKTATSKVASVNVTASADATVSSVKVVANGTYTATAAGNAFSATIGGTTFATVTITPNDGTAVVTCGSTIGSAGAAINVSATAGTQLSFSVTAGDGITTANYTLDISKVADKVATNNAYYLSANEAIYGGQRVVGADITMTYSDASNGTFAKAAADGYVSEHDANFVASTAGNGQNGSGSGISGTWYKFSPSVSGTLTVGIVVNADKQLYIYKDNKNTKITSGVTYWAYGSATLNSDLKASEKVYGLVTLNVDADHDYYFSVGGSKLGYYGFKFFPITTVNLNASGYATYSTYYDVEVSGAKAYTAELDFAGGAIACTEIVSGEVPAGNGVLLFGEANAEVTLTPTTGAAALANNDLKATTLSSGLTATKGSNDYYVLNGNTFKKYTGSTFAAHKAYFEVDGDVVQARNFTIVFDDETTGVKSIANSQEPTANGYYDLQGRRVAQPTKGLYIVNGKKLIMR